MSRTQGGAINNVMQMYRTRIKALERERDAAVMEGERRIDTLDRENQRLRKALKAMREVAAVADNGDPWYCEHEGVDSSKAFALAREALKEDA